MTNESIDPQNPGEGPAVITTDARGKWSTLGLAGGAWMVLIVKEGLMASEGQVRVNEFGPAQPIKVTLQPIPKEVQQQSEGAKAVEAIERGNALLQQEKFAEARAAYEEALAKLPEANHPAILRGIARTYFQDKQPDQAIATLERALALEPGNVESLNLIISLLVASGREKDAEPYMAQLPAGTSIDPTTILNMGIKKYNDGNGEGALADFDRVARENPDMAEAYYYRGLAHLSLGHNAEAKADFEKMLQLDPNHANANDAREFLKNL
jgi:tetratricopeptide (TPR) repeat protein